MIPFPIINTYGNISKPKIQNVKTTRDGTIFVLYNNGNLYAYGNNQNGPAGIGSTGKVTSWTLVKSGVKQIWTGNYGLLHLDYSGVYWGSGTAMLIGTSTSTFTDRTSLLSNAGSIDLTTIRNISFHQSAIFLNSTTNILYGYSTSNARGVMGNGTTKSLTPMQQLRTNISNIIACPNDSFYISTGNQLYGTGFNSSYEQGNGNSTQVNTWELQNTNTSNIISSTGFSFYKRNGSSWYATGSLTGLNSTATSWTVVSSLGTTAIRFAVACGPTVGKAAIFYNTSGQCFIVGNGQITGRGDTSNTNVIQSLTAPISNADLLGIELSDVNSLFWSTSEIYGSGTCSSLFLPGYSTAQTTHVPLNLPI